MPNTCPEASRYREAGAGPSGGSVSMAPNASWIRPRISSRETTFDAAQCVAPGTSMYSMNRISACRAPANATRASISSSLTPRISTVSSLTVPNASRAASMPARTSREVIAAGECLEAGTLQRVEADGDAPQSGLSQCAWPAPRGGRRWSSSPGRRACRSRPVARSGRRPAHAAMARRPSVARVGRRVPANSRVTRVSSSKVSSVVFGSHT